jgi:hypothetical protein
LETLHLLSRVASVSQVERQTTGMDDDQVSRARPDGTCANRANRERRFRYKAAGTSERRVVCADLAVVSRNRCLGLGRLRWDGSGARADRSVAAFGGSHRCDAGWLVFSLVLGRAAERLDRRLHRMGGGRAFRGRRR